MKEIILSKLKENMSQYISGEALSEILGVTRTAVWKYIKELKEEGYEIESSSKKGYRLALVPDLLNRFEISYQLNTKLIGRHIHYFDVIDSTSNFAKKLAGDGCDEGTTVVADVQTAGRGRLGRAWSSEGGKGIWMSIVLRPDVIPEEVQLITLAASVAIVRAIKEATGIEAGIKWPNDIILDGKKVCGVLTEMSLEIDRINYLVLGIGVNVNHCQEDFPADLQDKATSLKLYCKRNADMLNEAGECLFVRSEIIRSVLLEMENIYFKLGSGKLKEIIEEWKTYSVTLGNPVKIIVKNIEYIGTARDITADGRLVVDCSDGITREVFSGEISVRGILGYV